MCLVVGVIHFRNEAKVVIGSLLLLLQGGRVAGCVEGILQGFLGFFSGFWKKLEKAKLLEQIEKRHPAAPSKEVPTKVRVGCCFFEGKVSSQKTLQHLTTPE